MNKIILGLAAFLLLASTGAVAQDGKLEVTAVVEKETTVVNEAGEKRVELTEVQKVVPGDVVVYTVSYRVVTDAADGEAVENIAISYPIGEELTYMADSAYAPGAEITFSVDDGVSYAALEALTVDRDGVVSAATSDDLTHIRWAVPGELPPGSRGFARFKARVN
ncbi:MAG: hypothetical protein AB8F65_07325 [Woeseiaceae bacterium]